MGWSQGIVIPRSTTGLHAPSVSVVDSDVVVVVVVVVSGLDTVGGSVGAGVVDGSVVVSCVGSS